MQPDTVSMYPPPRKIWFGFMAVYVQDEEERAREIFSWKEISLRYRTWTLKSFEEKQHLQPPALYRGRSWVKTLEGLEIGRPSTYAPTITTIINRRYVAKENKTCIWQNWEVVNNIMVQAFPSIVDVNFTANMESLLDRSGGRRSPTGKTVVSNFYRIWTKQFKCREKNLQKSRLKTKWPILSVKSAAATWSLNMVRMADSLPARIPGCRNTKPYLERSVWHAEMQQGHCASKRPKRAESIMDVKIIRTVISCLAETFKEKCHEMRRHYGWEGNKLLCINEACGLYWK